VSIDPALWYPVAASHDLPYGHVYQTMLDGSPLAIWRASDGTVNIWEDRCPHRGVRFSIGIVRDDVLHCQYHAWRFASGSGACTFIPAQPRAKPPAAIHARVWPVAEGDGLVWTGVAPDGAPPALGTGEILRAIPVDRAAADMVEAVAAFPDARFVVQPVAADRCVVRGIADTNMMHVIDAALERLRFECESAASC
jgi:phenylpropionate dioxygenase-like ring-hydroxylating dioxygenase large terminal subunit